MVKHYYNECANAAQIQIEINSSVDHLIEENFSSESVIYFRQVMYKLLLRGLKDKITSDLSGKLKEVSTLINNGDSEQRLIFRQIIKLLLKIDASIINNLETKFLSKKYVDSFLILLEEKLKNNSPLEETCLSFIKVIYEESLTLSQVSLFLKTINKNYQWLTSQLLLLNDFRTIKEKLRNLFQNREQYSQELQDTINALISFPYNSYLLKREYIDLVVFILEHTYDFHDSLMKNGWLSYIDIEGELLRNTTFGATVNYSKYLYEEDPKLYYNFEANVILIATGHWLVQMAKSLPFSSKDKILVRLSRQRQDSAIKLFMQEFPEFEHLLPFV